VIAPILDHLDLVVTSLERSLPFYQHLLGFSESGAIVGEQGERVVYIAPPGADPASRTVLGLREKRSDAHGIPYDRYAVGVHHIAFRAASRAEVDERAEWLSTHGVTIESGPKEYHQYRPGYYAVFFYDPDGIKLEILHAPATPA
jgi:glyoxylase I family protein